MTPEKRVQPCMIVALLVQEGGLSFVRLSKGTRKDQDFKFPSRGIIKMQLAMLNNGY